MVSPWLWVSDSARLAEPAVAIDCTCARRLAACSPPGQYANTRGSKECKPCPAGTWSAGRAAVCQPCAPGFYAPPGSATCSPCKPGTFASAPRAATCSLCTAGNQCPTVATRAPISCPRGQFASRDGMRLCNPCPVNHFADTIGNKQCKRCAAGTDTRGMRGQSKCQAKRPVTRRRRAAR